MSVSIDLIVATSCADFQPLVQPPCCCLPANVLLVYQSANDRPVFATIGLRNQGWTITASHLSSLTLPPG